MGNAPSSEGGDDNNSNNNNNNNDDSRNPKNTENKSVSFHVNPVQQSTQEQGDGTSTRLPGNEVANETNDDDDENQEEPSSPPPRRGAGALTRSHRSSYFNLVTGTRITAPDGNDDDDDDDTRNDLRRELQWRNSNKSIRILTGHELAAPAPQWKRTLRRLGMIREDNKENEEELQQRTDDDTKGRTSRVAAKDDLAHSAFDPSMRHFRIESKALQNDNSSLLLDSTRTASIVSEYLRWTFSKSFLHVLLATFVQFLFLCTLFAIFIYIVDLEQPQCIAGATRRNATLIGFKDNRNSILFGDAYHLSWTTLSTVGYGVISPSLAKVDDDNTRCLGLNVLMAIEAFVGVLFGGVTGGKSIV